MNWWQKIKTLFQRKAKNPEWQIEDFVSELDQVMQQQAAESEEVGEIHEKITRQLDHKTEPKDLI